MTALSSADKLKLKLSAARVERAKRQALMPWKPRKASDKTALVMDFGQEKPALIYDDKGELPTFEGSVRSMSGKLGNHSNAIAARVHSISHKDRETGIVTTQVVHYEPDGYDHPSKLLCGDGVAYVPKTANCGNNSSPFKRVRKNPVVVVVKK
jgi:hypothetical protein